MALACLVFCGLEVEVVAVVEQELVMVVVVYMCDCFSQ
jgi:hypothetical protein